MEDPDPLNRPLRNGEVGVSWFESGLREILPETSLVLVDRLFQPGDFVKRAIDDVRSGVVTSIDVKAKLVHSITGEPLEGWKSLGDLGGETEVFMGDYVACDDWIGQVSQSVLKDA
jgi:ubiquitin-conjugating enzyme E2 O